MLQAEYDELLADPDVIQEDRDATALLLEHARTHLEPPALLSSVSMAALRPLFGVRR
jgi:hypothetical protein